MMKSILMISVGVAMMVSGFSVFGTDEFTPQLQKVVVNGQTLYDVGSKDVAKTLDINSATPAKIECTFVNRSGTPGEDPFMVFLHFDNNDKIVVTRNYSPAKPTTKWDKDEFIADTTAVDLSRIKGQIVELFVGLYRGADRISLINKGADYQQRLPVGKLNIK